MPIKSNATPIAKARYINWLERFMALLLTTTTTTTF